MTAYKSAYSSSQAASLSGVRFECPFQASRRSLELSLWTQRVGNPLRLFLSKVCLRRKLVESGCRLNGYEVQQHSTWRLLCSWACSSVLVLTFFIILDYIYYQKQTNYIGVSRYSSTYLPIVRRPNARSCEWLSSDAYWAVWVLWVHCHGSFHQIRIEARSSLYADVPAAALTGS